MGRHAMWVILAGMDTWPPPESRNGPTSMPAFKNMTFL